MYSIEDVKDALENEKLSDALFKLENLAERHGLTELAEWCSKELRGYENNDRTDEKTRYRLVDVNWRNIYGQSLNLSGEFVEANKLPMFKGVTILENYEETGMDYTLPDLANNLSHIFHTKVSHAEVHSTNIKSLLSDIRLEAKTKLQKAFPNINKKRTSYPSPNFSVLVKDTDLIKILSNRWNEANLAFEAGAYLATIILLGSILEGVLLDMVEKNPAQANSSSKSPKDRGGVVLPFEKWKLQNLIDVTHDCGWLKKESKDFSHVVRDYRNFVHPNKERKQGIAFREGTCKVIWEVVIDALS